MRMNPIILTMAAAQMMARQHTLGPEQPIILIDAPAEKRREDRAAKREQLLAWQREREQPIIEAAAAKRARKNAQRLKGTTT